MRAHGFNFDSQGVQVVFEEGRTSHFHHRWWCDNFATARVRVAGELVLAPSPYPLDSTALAG